jgi:4-amino-4-deoxy-L-arabinose transferase-like glycosyltransferase
MVGAWPNRPRVSQIAASLRRKPPRFWLEISVFVASAVLAAALRFIGLEQVPPGFNSDEAVGAVGALATLQRGPELYYEGQGGGGALGFWVLAATYALFGASIASTRGAAAFMGWLAVVGLYFAVREMFRPLPASDEPEQLAAAQTRARWLGLVSMFLLASSPWHISVSRMAFAGVLVPPFQIASIYFLWRGLRTGLRRHFVVSGALLAALLYVYLSGGFGALVYLFFFLLQAGLALWQTRRRSQTAPVMLRTHLINLAWCAGLALALILPAVFVYFAIPTQVTERAQEAFILNPRINQGDLWGTLGRSLRGNFTAFGLSPSWLMGRAPQNLVLPVPAGLGVFLGAIWSLWQIWRGRSGKSAPYLFVLVWLVVMLLPSILSPDIIPHQLRGVGAAPAVLILPAIVVVGLGQGAARLAGDWPRSWTVQRTYQLGLALVLVGFLGWIGSSTTRRLYSYFVEWPQTNEAQAAFHVFAVNMAREMSSENDPAATFILPLNTAAGDVAPNFTIIFLHDGPAGLAYIVDDERTLARALNEALSGRRRVHLVRWKASKHTGADPKEVLPYYLEKYGHLEGQATFADFTTRTYDLELTAPDFAAAETLSPAAVRFGHEIDLAGVAYGNAGLADELSRPQALSNDLLWVRLRWQLVAASVHDLKATVVLRDPAGRVVSQVDKLLLNNIWHQPTPGWSPGDEEDTYVLLPVPPGTAPGSYQLGLGVYSEDLPGRFTISRPAGGPAPGPGNIVDLGPVEVKPARVQPSLESMNLPTVVNQRLRPGLVLAGFGTGLQGTHKPGEVLDVPVVWQASEMLGIDYQMSLWARDQAGTVQSLGEATGLAGTAYPTSVWRPGEVLQGWLAARIPRGMANGRADVWLRLEGGGAARTEVAVGTIQIEGWQRVFEAPEPDIVTDARFANQATLLGLDLAPVQVTAGESLTVKLVWKAEAAMPVSYLAFVHLLGPDGLVYGQLDHVPGDGAYPTSGWLPGEIVSDTYQIEVNLEAPPGDYQLEIGLYDPATGQRLPVGDGDRVLVPGLEIVGPGQ